MGRRCRQSCIHTRCPGWSRSMPARSSESPCRRAARLSAGSRLPALRRGHTRCSAVPIDASTFIRISLQPSRTSFGGKPLPALRQDTPGTRTGPIDASTFVRISLQTSCTSFGRKPLFGSSPGTHQVLGGADRYEHVHPDLPADEAHVFRREAACQHVRPDLPAAERTLFDGKLLPALRRDTAGARAGRPMRASTCGSPCS